MYAKKIFDKETCQTKKCANYHDFDYQSSSSKKEDFKVVMKFKKSDDEIYVCHWIKKNKMK